METQTKEVTKPGNSTVPATVSKQSQVKDLLFRHQEQIQQALPKHIRADHFIRTALTCINKTPKLLECSVSSLMGALLTSAQLGLNPDGVLGEAYLIPFKNNKKLPNGNWQTVMEAQFIPGYRGLVQLAQRSGIVKSFQAREVYENDEFYFEFGLDPKLKHIPYDSSKSEANIRGNLAYVYAVVQFTNGGTTFEVMNINEVEMIRMKSKAPDSPAWKEFYPEMAKKTVIRKISKMCPLSPEFNKAIGLDETADFIGDQKNDREIMNYNFDQSITQEVEEAIHTDVVSEDTEQAEAKEEEKINKVANAVQESLDIMNKAKEKPAEVKPEEKEVQEEKRNYYAEYSDAINGITGQKELAEIKEQDEKVLSCIENRISDAWSIAERTQMLITSVRRSLNTLKTRNIIECTGTKYNEETQRKVTVYKIRQNQLTIF